MVYGSDGGIIVIYQLRQSKINAVNFNSIRILSHCVVYCVGERWRLTQINVLLKTIC